MIPPDDVTAGLGSGKFPVPPGRTTAAALDQEVKTVSHNPVIDSLLEAVHGLVAVLNENRQILAINDTLLESLGAKNLKEVLGLRLGEAVHCIHAEKAPGGCGTTEFCPSCGAAIAQVVALTQKHACEQLCAIEVPGKAGHGNLFFRVRAAPLTFVGHRYILLFLQDVSQEQRTAMLEQTFLHDLRNTAMGLINGANLLAESVAASDNELAIDVLNLANRLTREIELQRCLAHSNLKTFKCQPTPVSVDDFFAELSRAIRHHPAHSGRHLDFALPHPDHVISTDLTILHRILSNMILNALEATKPGGTVKITAERSKNRERFSVWNADCIPPAVALRIFQRNFSTKGNLGRGLGTYAMKLLGEKLLDGTVTFTTSPEDGTCFTLELPV